MPKLKCPLMVSFLALGLFALASCKHSQPLGSASATPTRLTCQSDTEPLGVDAQGPRLAWELSPAASGNSQAAFQVRVAASKDLLRAGTPDLWDSERIDSPLPHTVYAGKALSHSQPAFWQVRVWDSQMQASDWSAPARFVTGLASDQWKAKWIRAAETNATILLRREFEVKPGVKHAFLHVCGLGQYELHVNGHRVGEDVLSPGWSKYDRTCLYDTHDLSQALKAGTNAMGLFLANGMYNVSGPRYKKFTGSFGPLQAIAQLEIEYLDGTRQTISTDTNWVSHAGPITFSCIFAGEDYDARLEIPNWSAPGLPATGWAPVAESSGPGGVLRGHDYAAAPLRVFETLRPVKITPLRPGTEVYDLGQNAPLMLRMRIKGGAGSTVRVIPAELIKEDGSVDRGSVGGGEAWWQYTKSGNDTEEYTARFWYHGSRYLQVERRGSDSSAALPEIESLEGLVMHSASPAVGEFSCSDDLFNRIHTLIRWAQRANLMSVITDCPHRERLGWLEQYHLNGASLRYEWDLRRVFAKSMTDMADSQLPNGLVPDIAPEYVVFNGGFRDSPEWGSAVFLVPWQEYEWTGDATLLREHYDTMRRYVDYLGSTATKHIVSHGLGDWYDIGPKPPGYAQLTPKALTATAFYYEGARILANTARMLGKAQDAIKYSRLTEEIKSSFNREFFNAKTRQYAEGSQCANAIALVMDLAPEEHRAAVLEAVVKDVRSRGNSLTAGDVGYRYLLRALADGGRSDVIFDMNQQSEKPGYGYQLKQGATSLTEAWDAGRASSQNHFMLGHIMEWFYHDLAGLGPDPAGPGFERIKFQPQPVGNITWAKASYHSIRGLVASSWTRDGRGFRLQITVPPGSTATVRVPGLGSFKAPRGAKLLRTETEARVYEVGSGEHQFTSAWAAR